MQKMFARWIGFSIGLPKGKKSLDKKAKRLQ
jgi:hypothetical protein